MKKILCLMMGVLLLSAPAFAKDIGAGTVEVAGTANLGYQSTDIEVKDGPTTDQSSWGINLNSQYYFMPNVAAGLLLMYDSVDVDDVSVSDLAIGPIATYNFSMNEMVSLPVFGAITYNSISADEGSGREDLSGWGWVIGAGVKYFMNDYVSLNGTVDYGQVYYETDKTKRDIDQKGFEVFAGISVYLGGM